MASYKLTAQECADYDSSDARRHDELSRSLLCRFAGTGTTVYYDLNNEHFVVDYYE